MPAIFSVLYISTLKIFSCLKSSTFLPPTIDDCSLLNLLTIVIASIDNCDCSRSFRIPRRGRPCGPADSSPPPLRAQFRFQKFPIRYIFCNLKILICFSFPPFSGQAVPTDPGVHQKLGRRGLFSFLPLKKL